MNRTGRIVIVLVVVVLLLSALGCGAGGRSALYGRWKMSGINSIWEFKSDGKFVLEMDTTSFESRYEFVDDDTVTIYPPEGITSDNLVLDFKVDGDNLTLSANGADEMLTREK